MLTAFVLGVVAALAAIAYLGKKYHSSKAVLAAVQAELKHVEEELKAKEPALAAEALALIARLKSLL